jgi:DNA-binding HxlR family transcriptional regulator
MKDPRLGTSRAIWLYVLENGGLWTASELHRCIVPHDYKPAYLDNLLRTMADTGVVTRAPSPDRKNGVAYGVTKANRIPQGVTVEEVLRLTR